MSTTFPIKGDADKKIGAFFAPLSVSAQDAPNLTVKIRAGSFINSQNIFVEYAGGSSASIAAPVSASRWSVVGLTDSGTVTVIHGTTSGAPSVPEIPSGILPLAAIFMASTSTTITDAQVMDIRPFVRSVDNVPNLSTELADRPTTTDLNNALLLKADVDGTPNIVFTLNKDALSGTPNDNIDLVVKRGALPDVSIRWNETSDWWEFTNDGTTFSPFVSSVGTFAAINHTHVPADITNFNSTVDARISTATIAQSQVTSLVSDLAGKASASTVSTHIADSSIHFTLPIAQANVTGLTAALSGKVDSAAPGTLTGNLTVKTTGNQPITLVSSDTGSSGLVIDRTTVPGPNARFEWDETSEAWLIGVTGNMDTVLTDAVVATKADKVTGAVNGHFAGLNASGNLTDSGFSSSSFISANAPIVAGTATKITYDADGLVVSGTTLGATDVTSAFTIAQNQVMAGPVSGAATNPAFRSLVAADIPTIAQSQVTNLVSDLSGKATAAQGAKADTALQSSDIGVSIQAYDADLGAIAALTGTSGFLKTDGAGVWSVDTNSYTVSEPSNQVVYGTGTGVDSSNKFTWNDTSSTLLINGVISNASGSASTPSYSFTGDLDTGFYGSASNTIGITSGGNHLVNISYDNATLSALIKGADGQSGQSGHAIQIRGGTSTAAGFSGGSVTIYGGSTNITGLGGGVLIKGNPDDATTGYGGTVQVVGGNTYAIGDAGGVSVYGGTPVDGNGGTVYIAGSNGVGTDRNGGNILTVGGNSTGTGSAGTVLIRGGSGLTGGEVSIEGGFATGNDSNGGSIIIRAQNSAGAGNGNGGDITLKAGMKTGTGIDGVVKLTSDGAGNTSSVSLQFMESNSNSATNYVALKAPDSIATNRTWTLPQNDPTTVADRFLTTDSSGQWSFAAIPVLPTYAVGSLPTGIAGGMIYVSDATPNPAMCFYNGTSWIDVVTGVAVV